MQAIETWLEAERDQLAAWLPVALAAGIALWFVLPDPAAWSAAMLGTGAVVVATAPFAGRLRLARALCLCALAILAGCGLVWARAERVAAPRLARPAVVSFEAVILSVQPQPARESTRLLLRPLRAPQLPPKVRVSVADADRPAGGLARGATVSLRARLLPPALPDLPGGYDFARVAWFMGLGATGKALPGRKVIAAAPPSGWRDGLADMRAQLSAHIERRVPGAAGGVATAFVTGDEGALPQADAEAMRRSGLAHLLSVSGLHVAAVIAGTMWLVIALLALSPRLALRLPLPLVAAGAGALAGIGYTLLTGAEVPTLRSCIAALLVLGGLALGREAMTMRLVAAGALAVMLPWPEAAAGPSFQLSFAAVIAIVALHEHPGLRALFLKREEGWGRRLLREFGSLLATGIVVELALMPIAIYHFHRAGIYGAAANLVAIPLTTFVVMPLEALALLLDVAGLGAPAWWAVGKALALLLWIAHRVAALPGAVTMLPGMPAGAYALMVAGGLWLALWHTRLRRLGWLGLGAGALWALTVPAPDLLVTRDGRHVAVRDANGALAVLRPKAKDYVVSTLSEGAGVGDGRAYALDAAAGARCSEDACAMTLARGGRRWRLLATRSGERLRWSGFVRACADADIVVSDRRLPAACRPRWLRVDPVLLARTGGLVVTLADGRVATSRREGDRHPWRMPPAGAVARSAGERGRQPFRHHDRRIARDRLDAAPLDRQP